MIFALAFSLHIFLGVFFGQGSRPLAWASTPWAICRTDRLSTIDYRLSTVAMGVLSARTTAPRPAPSA